jgi:hypothetical protein
MELQREMPRIISLSTPTHNFLDLTRFNDPLAMNINTLLFYTPPFFGRAIPSNNSLRLSFSAVHHLKQTLLRCIHVAALLPIVMCSCA